MGACNTAAGTTVNSGGSGRKGEGLDGVTDGNWPQQHHTAVDECTLLHHKLSTLGTLEAYDRDLSFITHSPMSLPAHKPKSIAPKHNPHSCSLQ